MKIILLVLLGSFISINARLIEKVTTRTLTTDTKTTSSSSPPVRLTRDVFEDDLNSGISKEENIQSAELMHNNKRARHYFKSKQRTDVPSHVVRVIRDSREKRDKSTKITTAKPSAQTTKPKNTLVKKPIPKFNEMDYEDDFQMKIIRTSVPAADSGEHEDEDFNVDDYEFDVNHDEFIGRGKPLEPRTKHKESRDRPNRPQPKHDTKHAPVASEVKNPTKAAAPASRRPISNKKERAVKYGPKKVGEKEDYYDDSTTTKATGKEKGRELDDEFNDDNEDSKEFEGKFSSIRTVRSPKITFVDKVGETGSFVMSKVLSILPVFPQVPNKHKHQ